MSAADRPLVFGSVCSGIEAASVAWKPLGWKCAFMSEIEAFPRAVLAHHYPEVPLHGDFTTIRAGDYEPIDLLVGGTPCQSFSVAGLRGGLDDERGNLALEYLRLADRLRPRWLVWENVPGVLSSNGGRDFGSILGGMGELGYGVAYRVLDAQFFGVAQRRRRVFVVGHLGDWRRAAAVLFERHSLSGHPAPRREAGPSVAALTANGVGTCGADDNQGQAGHLIPQGHIGETAPTLNAAFGSKLGLDNQHIDSGAGLFVAHTLKGEGFDASEDGTGRGTPIVPVCFSAKDHGADAMSDLAPTLRAGGHSKSHANAGVMPAIAYGITRDALDRSGEGAAQNAAERSGLGIIAEQAQCLKAKGPGAVALTYPINPNALCGDTHAKKPSKDAAGVMRLRDPGLGVGDDGDPADTLQAAGPGAVAFALRGRSGGAMPEVEGVGDRIGALRAASGGSSRDYVAGSAVRRLTPRECERLQGFPDDYTLIPHRGKPAADGPRYKALGNSMAVPVMAWIGQRIAQVEAIAVPEQRAAA